MTDEIIVIEVHVHQDEFGRISSVHEFRSPEDQEKSQRWKNGGVQQIAHALLTEATRREAFASALVRLTQEPDFLTTYAEASDDEKTGTERHLAGAIQVIIHRTLGKTGPDIVKEVLEMMVLSSRLNN